MNYIGRVTGKAYDLESFPWQGEAGELLDLAPFEMAFDLEKIRSRPPTLWRYLEALPFAKNDTVWQDVTMGEGFTPLIALESKVPNVFIKVDYQMPTLSFKDRGAVVLVAKAKSLGAKQLVQDSSGNAGTSIAAYAARAGLSCDIFVPDSTSPKKVAQMKAHGAKVNLVPGTREDTANVVKDAANQPGVFYASHVYNPFFYQGTKTYAYELWEQLGYKVPDVLILPVGNGTLVLGAYYGFSELLQAGLTDKLPRFIAIQAAKCAPLEKAFKGGLEGAEPVVNEGTLAEGIAIAAPARHAQILEIIYKTGGHILSVPEEEIEPARAYLSSRGYYVEITTAINYAGYLKAKPMIRANETVVIPLCGAGLKSG
ncbi:MAG: threonine synthase [Trueperaceae bacterium]